MKDETRVIIADDHRLMRNVLKSIFNREGDMTVVAEARNAEEVFRQIDNQCADVMVLDLNMPGKDGLEILKELQETRNNLPVVVLTLFPQERFREKVIQLGAVDCLTKDCQPHEIVDAVRKAKNRDA
jgi:two-component system, NarL family, invasion response regulator UvrY